VLVSRKVGNAVKRSKIKRITREVFRKEIKRNPPFIDVLIQIRPGIKIYNKNEYEICLREWIKESKTN
jgi:ribonuclease P protein component